MSMPDILTALAFVTGLLLIIYGWAIWFDKFFRIKETMRRRDG